MAPLAFKTHNRLLNRLAERWMTSSASWRLGAAGGWEGRESHIIPCQKMSRTISPCLWCSWFQTLEQISSGSCSQLSGFLYSSRQRILRGELRGYCNDQLQQDQTGWLTQGHSHLAPQKSRTRFGPNDFSVLILALSNCNPLLFTRLLLGSLYL